MFRAPSSVARSVSVALAAVVLFAGALAAAQQPTPSPRPAMAPGNWQERFNAVYRLDEGEVVRYIPPPLIPERVQFFRAQVRANRVPEQLVVEWDGRQPRFKANIAAKGNLRSALAHVVQVEAQEYQIPERLMGLPFPGDWVVREGSSREERFRALEKIIAKELRRQIRFEKRMQRREALVVSGAYKQVPIGQGHDPACIHVFVGQMDPDDSVFIESGTLAEFFQFLGSRVRKPIADETQPASVPARVRWAHHSSGSMMGMRSAQESGNQLAALLGNVARQTSLQFRNETREVPVWVAYEGPAIAAAAARKPAPAGPATRVAAGAPGGAATVRVARITEMRWRPLESSKTAAPDDGPVLVSGEALLDMAQGLTLTLDVAGPAVKGATQYGPVTITEAVDDAGTDLAPQGEEFESPFSAVQGAGRFSPRGAAARAADGAQQMPRVTVRLHAPSRKATKIVRLKGAVQATVPTAGRRRVTTVSLPNLLSHRGKLIEHAVLREAGVQIRWVYEPEPGVTINPTLVQLQLSGNVAAIESVDVVDASGKSVVRGRSVPRKDDAGSSMNSLLDLRRPADAGMALKLQVSVGQKAVTVPIDLKDIPLP